MVIQIKYLVLLVRNIISFQCSVNTESRNRFGIDFGTTLSTGLNPTAVSALVGNNRIRFETFQALQACNVIENPRARATAGLSSPDNNEEEVVDLLTHTFLSNQLATGGNFLNNGGSNWVVVPKELESEDLLDFPDTVENKHTFPGGGVLVNRVP